MDEENETLIKKRPTNIFEEAFKDVKSSNGMQQSSHYIQTSLNDFSISMDMDDHDIVINNVDEEPLCNPKSIRDAD